MHETLQLRTDLVRAYNEANNFSNQIAAIRELLPEDDPIQAILEHRSRIVFTAYSLMESFDREFANPPGRLERQQLETPWSLRWLFGKQKDERFDHYRSKATELLGNVVKFQEATWNDLIDFSTLPVDRLYYDELRPQNTIVLAQKVQIATGPRGFITFEKGAVLKPTSIARSEMSLQHGKSEVRLPADDYPSQGIFVEPKLIA